MKLLLDTNVYSDACRGDAWAVDLLRTATEILVSPIMLAELLSGFCRGSKEKQNRAQLARFLSSPRVREISITSDTAEWFASILHKLQQSGSPIPTHDIWLASSAMEQGARLATRDQHFQHVAELQLLLKNKG
jgi:tRNA(fMet)-specific endonuclease VapC